MTTHKRQRWNGLVHGLACVLVLAACGADQVAMPEPEMPIARQQIIPTSQPVEVQAMTVGVNGQLIRGPFGSSLCSFQNNGGRWFHFLPPVTDSVLVSTWFGWECTSVPAAPPGYSDPPAYYNGGSVDVWLVSATGDSLLGHIKAKYEKLVLYNLPVGATLRIRASPNFDPAPGVLFNSWTGSHGYSTSTELLATVHGGEYFRAEFQMPRPPGGGGPDPEGPPCIDCP